MSTDAQAAWLTRTSGPPSDASPMEFTLEDLFAPVTSKTCGARIFDDVPMREVDGWQQRLTVYQPLRTASVPSPALMFMHGGGFEIGDQREPTALARVLAAKLGVTTFSTTYRLGRAGHPSYPRPLHDAVAAWEWIDAHHEEWNIDPERRIVGGASAGACLSALALTRGMLPGAKALLTYWGPMDFVARWYDNGERPGAEPMLLGATYLENPTLYHQASPLTHAHPGLPPAFFAYGRTDNVVHPRQAHLAQAAWTAHGCVADVRFFDNIGHGIVGDNRPQMLEAFEATLAFLKERLGWQDT